MVEKMEEMDPAMIDVAILHTSTNLCRAFPLLLDLIGHMEIVIRDIDGHEYVCSVICDFSSLLSIQRKRCDMTRCLL